jgi:hypothetical protein
VWHYAPALGVLLCGGDILVILGLTDGLVMSKSEINHPWLSQVVEGEWGETTIIISGCFWGRGFGTNPMFSWFWYYDGFPRENHQAFSSL